MFNNRARSVHQREEALLATENQRERDLVLGETQFAYIQDRTKGHTCVAVGPYKTSLAGTDQPVRYNVTTASFDPCGLEEAGQTFAVAGEGSYVILTNPAKPERSTPHPGTGNTNAIPLDYGRRIVIPGPASFALWPGQSAIVVEGHRLRSNQYLVARVYNPDAARDAWTKAVEVRPNQSDGTPPADQPIATDLMMGQQLIIKGTRVSFFIPPTGIEVVPDESGNHIREAVTLERLEYCLLLDEDGEKRYVPGPAVVFPEPTESFVTRDGSRKFPAVELNDDMGIHVKVIADYDEDGQRHLVGEELFITGKDKRIYFPREEHAIIRYGNREKVYGIVIPEGEARYVLDKREGSIKLIKGPKIYLADPRHEVIVRRVLTPQQVADWFPGNKDAETFNAALRSQAADGTASYVAATQVALAQAPISTSSAKSAGDSFQRGTEYTPPRTITIDPRFDGAVQVAPWIGYAVLILSKTGTGRVVVGPAPVILEFGETLQVLTLSMGKPKSTDRILRTAYLAVHNNQVGDLVTVTTKDMVEAEIKVSYRVNFVGETATERARWFSVQNYVKFLCDHTRSLLRHACKGRTIEELAENVATIVRDTILGTRQETGTKRPGRTFEENGMHVYDVEILGIKINDPTIDTALQRAQHSTVIDVLTVKHEEQQVELNRRRQEAARTALQEQATTDALNHDLKRQTLERSLAIKLAEATSMAETARARRELEASEDEHRSSLDRADLTRWQSRRDAEQKVTEAMLVGKLQEIKAEADAYAQRMGSVSPQFTEAMNTLGLALLAAESAKALGPMTLLGGDNVLDFLQKMFKGTPLGKVVEIAQASSNGGPPKALPPVTQPPR